jgi:SAM-dependent methyltransferase
VILDAMSSWVSHLPPDVAYERVVGLGMNDAELSRNPRLASYVVHDLNRDPQLPFDDDSFDAAIICVSIQYLTQPVAVLRDLARIVRAGGPIIWKRHRGFDPLAA